MELVTVLALARPHLLVRRVEDNLMWLQRQGRPACVPGRRLRDDRRGLLVVVRAV